MTDRITRKTFIRRAAASGSLLTVPGLLAACGGGGGGGGGTSAGATTQQLAKTLHFSNWTLYMDMNKKNHTFPSLIAFQKKYRHPRRLRRGHQRQRVLLPQDPAPAGPRAVDRAATSSC